jgi:hypothetical protein
MNGLISQWVAGFALRLGEFDWLEGISNANLTFVSIRACSIALLTSVLATSAHPQDMHSSFVEFKGYSSTTTYDLRTVKIIQPGKFVIIETVLDNPDMMRFRLKVLDTLRSHCARPEGLYPVSAEVFTLGPADMPVKEIEVRVSSPEAGTNFRWKFASWWLPYFKTMAGTGPRSESYRCNQPYHTETEEYLEHRNVILNGIRNKVLFDCNRGLQGEFFDEDDKDPIHVDPVENDTVGSSYYIGVCRAVNRKDPYLSD